jgi:carbon storage regulator
MLVLSRKIGEKIVVPACGLTVTVVGVKGNRVRLGIAAPEDIRVDREEVWLRNQLEQADGHMEPACSY